MTYVYHYRATGVEEGNRLDGIAEISGKILNYDSYRILKNDLIEEFKLDGDVVIESLNFLHEVEN